MMFLLPVGGVVNHKFGVLTSPAHFGVVAGIKAGMPWAADNGVFSGAFDPDTYPGWLDSMRPFADTCLFVLAPDVVGGAKATLVRYRKWAPEIRAMGFPVGFAAQDGCEDLELPTDFDALFVGGTTEWKLSAGALAVIRKAQAMHKHIHIGRVNWWQRYSYFRGLEGSDDWTCDGTRTRFDGTDKTIDAWVEYMERPYNLRLALPSGDRHG